MRKNSESVPALVPNASSDFSPPSLSSPQPQPLLPTNERNETRKTMSDISSTLSLALFLASAGVFFTSATHDSVGLGQGGGSAVLEKEEAVMSGRKGTFFSPSSSPSPNASRVLLLLGIGSPMSRSRKGRERCWRGREMRGKRAREPELAEIRTTSPPLPSPPSSLLDPPCTRKELR